MSILRDGGTFVGARATLADGPPERVIARALK